MKIIHQYHWPAFYVLSPVFCLLVAGEPSMGIVVFQ